MREGERGVETVGGGEEGSTGENSALLGRDGRARVGARGGAWESPVPLAEGGVGTGREGGVDEAGVSGSEVAP